ncbi:MAG: hypothetical protein M1429_03575 [Patescibacteria group bacterium]|nr:hypothetical protein [Patescibacteria group bacterium]
MTKTLKILLIILGVLLLVSVGVIFWLSKNSSTKFQTSPTNTPNSTSLAPNIDTSDWKTFANTKYGYSFKYPSNWYLYDSNLGLITVQPEKYNPKEILSDQEAKAISFNAQFDSSVSPESDIRDVNDLSFDDMAKQWQQENPDGQTSMTTIDSHEALNETQAEKQRFGQGTTEIFVKDRHYLLAIIKDGLADPVYFQEILTTVKFN